MKVLKKNLLNVLLAVVLAIGFAFAGWVFPVSKTAVKAEGETTVNLTFSALGLNGGENNELKGNGIYYTCIRFNQGVFTGSSESAIDYNNLVENTTFSGESEWGFAPGATHWAAGYKSDALFNFIYLYTMSAPAAGDTVQMKAGAYFTMAGTMADSTACNDKYVLTEDINLKFNGTAWETYVPVVDNTQFVTEFTNNGQFTLSSYNGVEYEVVDGAAEKGLLAGYGGAVLKIVNEGAAYINIDFTASQIKAFEVESVVARVYEKTYSESEGDELRINNTTGSVGTYDFSNWCDVSLPIDKITGSDGNLGAFAFGMRDRVVTAGAYFYIDSITVTMKKPALPTDVTFSHINSSWNNNSETLANGFYYTVLHMSGLTSSGYYTQGDDWTEMMANATINGGASYFSFCPASVIAGPNAACDFMIIYSAQAPAEGDEFFLPAGTTFKVGGDDTNVYKLTADINLRFRNGAWESFVPVVEPDVVEVNFQSVNVTWNNYAYENMYCSLLHFDGEIPGGSLYGDYSDLISKMTINGEPVDSTNVSFICTAWVGASGGIMLRFVNNPEVGARMVLPAGATFTVDSLENHNVVYKLASDVTLVFNGTTWTTPVVKEYYVFETDAIYHTYKTEQNADGSFTYTLPEYEREGKVLLGYVMNNLDGSGEQTFIPSGEYTTDKETVAFIALWGEFTTVDGASIRISGAETSGIRWTTNIDEEGFKNISYWAAGNYQFGTELSADGFAENFDIPTSVWKVEDREYTGVLIDINAKYYGVSFTARGYVDITYHNGVTKRIYATANDTTRSIKQVAEKAIASGDYSGAELAILQQIAGV